MEFKCHRLCYSQKYASIPEQDRRCISPKMPLKLYSFLKFLVNQASFIGKGTVMHNTVTQYSSDLCYYTDITFAF